MRSPGKRLDSGISVPMYIWLVATRGKRYPNAEYILMVKPEQSVPLVRDVPPYTYGLPINLLAYSTMLILKLVFSSSERRLFFHYLLDAYNQYYMDNRNYIQVLVFLQ